ncbi:hypothetical protein ES676_09695 [Bizionia saleffrena]|uniref:Uncharacterized protein n=1 Tax=Bizionia saleffrena TaxID=291189 RepID=A0A8H2LDF6_9FLAO|nr:hypothetical protein [Bizionia saleffrena]TYB73021.1 hypothetical protein ES676_09695 [Bizionia saleffrena]
MKKEIKIRKKYISTFFLSFLIGFVILYGLEHFGNFSYLASSESSNFNGSSKSRMTGVVSFSDPVTSIYYESYFGKKIRTNGNGFTVGDMHSEYSVFKKYPSKSFYYTQATIKDYVYGLYISLMVFLVILFFLNFKIKLL